MPLTESEHHLFQQPSKKCFETIQKISLPHPKSTMDAPWLASTSSNAAQTTVGFTPKLETEQNHKTITF